MGCRINTTKAFNKAIFIKNFHKCSFFDPYLMTLVIYSSIVKFHSFFLLFVILLS